MEQIENYVDFDFCTLCEVANRFIALLPSLPTSCFLVERFGEDVIQRLVQLRLWRRFRVQKQLGHRQLFLRPTLLRKRWNVWRKSLLCFHCGYVSLELVFILLYCYVCFKE